MDVCVVDTCGRIALHGYCHALDAQRVNCGFDQLRAHVQTSDHGADFFFSQLPIILAQLHGRVKCPSSAYLRDRSLFVVAKALVIALVMLCDLERERDNKIYEVEWGELPSQTRAQHPGREQTSISIMPGQRCRVPSGGGETSKEWLRTFWRLFFWIEPRSIFAAQERKWAFLLKAPCKLVPDTSIFHTIFAQQLTFLSTKSSRAKLTHAARRQQRECQQREGWRPRRRQPVDRPRARTPRFHSRK